MKRLVLLLIFVAAPLTFEAAPASAHRSGCHRWHSCPSDTGSYVCGDTGYTSGCPTSYTTPTTRYTYTTPTTAYRSTTPTTAYRYTTTTTGYSSYQPPTTPAAIEESEASTTGDAIVGSLAVAGGVGFGAFRLIKRKKNQARSE